MGYKTTYTLTSSKPLIDITISDGVRSQKWNLPPDEEISFSSPAGSGPSEVDSVATFTCEDWEGVGTTTYTFNIRQVMPSVDDNGSKGSNDLDNTKASGGTDSAVIWDTSNWILKSTGFQDVKFSDSPTPTSFIPEPLNLYAWKTGSDIIYTDNDSPAVGDLLYTKNGEMTTDFGNYENCSISSVSNNQITLSGTPK